MKKLMLSIFATVVLLSFSSVASAQFFGWDSEKIIKVMDFPDDDRFQMPMGEYMDAGYIYKQVTIFFVPVWNYDARWVGYVGSDERYLELDRSELQEFAVTAGLELPDSPSLPFWDSIGGKIVFILLVLIWLGFQLRSSKEEEAKEADKQ